MSVVEIPAVKAEGVKIMRSSGLSLIAVVLINGGSSSNINSSSSKIIVSFTVSSV